MGGKVYGVARFLANRYYFASIAMSAIGPNDFRTVVAIELLDTFARIAREFAERVNGMREHAREHLHSIVRGARPVGPLIAPAADDRPNLFRAVELGNAKLAKVIGYAIKPRCPIRASRSGKLLVIVAGLVERDQ